MNVLLRYITILLLAFNGIGAVYGGWHLMTDPTGLSIQLSHSYLNGTIFPDYTIPGIILFVFIGIFSIIAALWVVCRWKNDSKLVIIEGVLLTGWIVIQMIMIRTVYFLQFILGGIGILLLLAGFILLKKERTVHKGS